MNAKYNRLGALGVYASIMDTHTHTHTHTHIHTPNQDLHSVRIFNTFGVKPAVS
jgi:hypothetical protein